MAEGIIQKAGGGGASDECTAGKAQVLAGYTAITRDSGDEPVNGTMVNHTGIPSKIENRRLNNGRFEVAVAQGYHGCYWAGDSYEYMELAEVASTLGLTAAKLLKGQTVCGVAGTATSDANATAAYIYSGKTAYVNGAKVTGSMTVGSVVSFSVAAYSTSQVLCTWKNPAKGPYSGVVICAKAGGYPTSINDNRKYTGVGSNSALNGTSTTVISGLTAGTTYYFRIWVYCTCSAGDIYSGYLQAACAPTAHGRNAFTQSGTFTVPAGVRSINIHCTGGGSSGQQGFAKDFSGGGGAGGYTTYKNSIAVTPGQQIVIVVGAGGSNLSAGTNGGVSSASRSGVVLVSANGGLYKAPSLQTYGRGADGGSGGGAAGKYAMYLHGGAGGSDGGNGEDGSEHRADAGKGQGTTTKEFGTGTLYSGGGGGAVGKDNATSAYAGGAGGAGGGGAGASYNTAAVNGSVGTGGGGGGGWYNSGSAGRSSPGLGGSGNVIITW